MTVKEIEPGLWVSDEGHVFRELSQHYRGGQIKYPFVAHKGQRLDVHRLVAKAFIPNPENKPCVCHRDDDSMNPRAENLWWGTYQENMDDMIDKGRNRMFKNISEHLAAILTGIEQGMTQREIAASLGVTESRVSQILSKYRARQARRKKAQVYSHVSTT